MKQLRSFLMLVIVLLISFNFLISCKNNKITDNIQEELTCWYSTYGLIGGNAMYGGWDSAFKKKHFEQHKTSYMKQAIREYLQKFTSWD
ncbi:hypothetical protein [Spiroplasma endosymbiont of Dilophus febrilis]|uniref:hypothetical protein n=1 Tax=Spiroplasma endosymbiont of Dilophus febrilis TaxID=3066292 RepID=UPI00313E33E5